MTIRTIDVFSKAEYPGDALSNFYHREFVFDGVQCASIEGLLQSLKTKNEELQQKICMLDGKSVKNFFLHKPNNILWKITGNLYWRGKRIKRSSDEYQKFMDKIYETVSRLDDFKAALLATEDAIITHSIGKTDTRKTILTEYEFVSRLEKCRNEISENN